MRSCLALAFLVAAACGGTQPGGGDDAPVVDAPPGTGDPDAAIDPPARGFQVVSPYVELPAKAELTYCYYFRTPNTETYAINKWESDMTPGSHHMIMYTSEQEMKPAGTITTAACGIGGGGGTSLPTWTYSAQTAQASIDLPADDGTGRAVAVEIAPNTPAYFQMHYYNPGDTPLQVRVVLNAYALEPAVQYTKTAAFVTYYSNIEIPPNAVNHVEPANHSETSCSVPAGSKFWLMSTHSHKQSVKTRVLDGPQGAVVFESTDWEHPEAAMWPAAPFKEFSSGKLTYECTYTNLDNNKDDTVYDGDSAVDDEMCMASGYFFPAPNGPRFCYNNFTF